MRQSLRTKCTHSYSKIRSQMRLGQRGLYTMRSGSLLKTRMEGNRFWHGFRSYTSEFELNATGLLILFFYRILSCYIYMSYVSLVYRNRFDMNIVVTRHQ